MKEKPASQRLIVIGASAGGPATILSLIRELPENTPGIIIVQHLCKGFAARMATYLDVYCAQGLLDMRKAGALTIVQKAESCASSSMPAEAKKKGGAEMELAPREITACMELFSKTT